MTTSAEATPFAPTSKPARPEFGEGALSRSLPILDSTLHWVEHGEGDPIVFLHGNPTGSFLWRNIFNRLHGKGRLLALDLIGFGESGKPDIEYSLDEHQEYVNAWFEALELTNVTLVIQDYGAAFGITWAREHSDRVKALVIAEPVIAPIASADLPEGFVALRGEVLKPGVGEQIVLEDNKFITELLPSAVLGGLSDDVQAVYAEPFPTPESRRPILVFPRALPVDAQPQSTVDFLAANEKWLKESPQPKVLLTFEPGFLTTPAVIEWARKTIGNLTVQSAGAGSHYVQEDAPAAIAAAVVEVLSPAE